MSRLLANAASALAPTCDYTTGCITCGDVAIPLTVLRLDEGRGLALCADDEGNSETVEILTAPTARPSRDWLAHVRTGRALCACMRIDSMSSHVGFSS